MIHVVTDSASDLPSQLLRGRSITVVPLEVRLGELDPAELANVDPEQFWQLAAQTTALAETSAPSPGAFKAAFSAAASRGYNAVICVTISSELSATYQSACAGAAEVRDEIAVAIIDSRSATMGEGLLVLEAAAATAEDMSLDEAAARVQAAIGDVSVFGTLDTLETLRRGGRIGSAQAFIGSMLAIKPVVEVRNGVVEGESRQRTRQRSLRYLAEKVIAAGPLKRLAVVHAAADDVATFLEMLTDVELDEDLIVGGIGPVIGAHTGRGTIGVCFQRTSVTSATATALTS